MSRSEWWRRANRERVWGWRVEIPQDRWCLAGRRSAWSHRQERDIPLRLLPSPLKHTQTHSESCGSSQRASVSLSDTHTQPHGAQYLHMTTWGMPLSLGPVVCLQFRDTRQIMLNGRRCCPRGTTALVPLPKVLNANHSEDTHERREHKWGEKCIWMQE